MNNACRVKTLERFDRSAQRRRARPPETIHHSMKTYPTRLPGAALLSLALCVAQSGSTARGAVFSDQAALNQAAVFAQNSIFDDVGQLSVFDSGGRSRGSGVITGDGSWVLTAGHVITYSANNGYVINQVGCSLGADVNSPRVNAVADSWYVYPGFTGAIPGQGVDLALVHLSSPIGSVAAAPLYSGTQNSLTGVAANMAGRGPPVTALAHPTDSSALEGTSSVMPPIHIGSKVSFLSVVLTHLALAGRSRWNGEARLEILAAFGWSRTAAFGKWLAFTAAAATIRPIVSATSASQ